MLELFTNSTLLNDFTQQQIIASIFIFIWSGFVRSGLGFGGAALGLPFMLMVDDSPLFWLPVIGFHLLFFTSLTIYKRLKNVDWVYIRYALKYILPAKIIGVFGLLSLPNDWLVFMIYSITFLYALMWLTNFKIKSESGWGDKSLLALGGYVSGTSLTGAPLIVAVFMQHVQKSQLRDTLFVIWFILVTIKMATFTIFSVNLQFFSSLLLLPFAWIGHLVGLKMHEAILKNDDVFRRVIGALLMLICIIGFTSLFIL